MSLGSLDKVVTTEDLCALNSPGSWKLKRQAEWAIAHKKSDKLPTHMRVHSKIVITCDSYIYRQRDPRCGDCCDLYKETITLVDKSVYNESYL